MIVCNRCGKENQDHYKFCLGCGGELGARTAAPHPAAVEALGDVSPSTRSGAARIPSTKPSRDGGAVAVNRSTSPSIDVQTTHPSTMRSCPSCGNQVPFEFVFCGQCGARLGAEAARPQPMAAAEPQLRGKLVLIRPDGSEGGFFPIVEGDNVVGRAESPLFESDTYLSPLHASFVLAGSQLTVRDEGSLNGVFVKMTGEEEIRDGEVFRMGQELLRFDVIPPAQPLDDGTEVMGSPNPGYWGRVSLIIGRDQDGSAFPLYGESMVVGRERGDILFPEDGYVSGTHARISFRDGRYFLADLNSSNGSFLRVRGERPIPSGAFLLMGQQLFRVQYA